MPPLFTPRGHRLGSGVWIASAILTNPTDATVVVDTGPLVSGLFLIAVHAAASVAWVYDVQHRDATNTSTIKSQRRRPATGNEDFIMGSTFVTATDERIRIVLVGTITGELQASLFAQEML